MAEIHPVPFDERNALSTVSTGKRTVALLKAQADALRLELTSLRRDLAELQRDFSEERAAQLLEANERLVLRSLHAETLAESAVSSLGELTRSSQRDALTDTPNRALMLDRVEHAISSARRRGTRLALLFVDADGFKHLNDHLGHAVGDAALQLIARRLEMAVRDSDTVSRHGGDEFLVLLAELLEPTDAVVIVERMLASVAASARVGSHTLHPSVSVGIAVWPEDADDAEALIALADAAMYRSKKRGPGGYAFHAGANLAPPSLELFPADPSLRGRSPHEAETYEPRAHDLREANEHLVLAALDSDALGVRTDAAHRRQIDFLAMVAHELRNPLGPIKMAAELLGRLRTDDLAFARQQQIVKRQVVHMTRLVEDLLDGARVGIGKFRLEVTELDLAEVLTLARDTCLPAITERRQRLTSELGPGPMRLRGDPMRLAQVFTNLLDNASKYTPKGGSLQIASARRGECVEVTISDDGIGITADALPHIFELFVQDERALMVDSRGLGIGLAIVRDLVVGHGGSVTATSAGPGLGSRFVVTLPMAAG